MRRPLTAAAIAIVLPLIAACSAGRADTTGSGATARRIGGRLLDRRRRCGSRRPGRRDAGQAARATDAQLKATLTEAGAEVGRIKPDIDTVDDAKLDQLQQRHDTLCAGWPVAASRVTPCQAPTEPGFGCGPGMAYAFLRRTFVCHVLACPPSHPVRPMARPPRT